MANTPWVDRTSEEIMSHHVSGLQDAVKNIEQSLDMDTEAVSEHSMTLLADADGVYRVAEAIGKRNWLTAPAPVIEQYISETWTTITEGFTVDYAGGAVIFNDDQVGEQFRASFTRVKNTSGFQTHKLDYTLFKDGAFELWASRTGHRYRTIFDTPNPGDITEEIRNSLSDDLVASKLTEFDAPTLGQITETLHVVEGNMMVKKVTTFEVDGSITEEVSEVA